MTVKNSLETMMRNVVSGLKFSHPKTKCVQDSHCYDWFNTKIIGIARARNTPRCVQQGREKFMTCEVRGTYGQNCSVYEDGERVSDGMFEFTCDKGYTCVKVKEGGWFTNWEIYDYPKGECRPINKKK